MRKKRYFSNDDGAVTVDWVVLTAAMVGLVALISSEMEDGAVGGADVVSSALSDSTVTID